MKDLTSFTVSVLRELEDEGRFSTAHVYRSTLRSFSRYWAEENDGNSIPLREAFTSASLERFERHLQSRMLKMKTLSTYLRMLRALYYRALRMGLVGYVPGLFDRVYTGTHSDVKRALPPAGMGAYLPMISPPTGSWKKRRCGLPCSSCFAECPLPTLPACASATCRMA